MDGSARSSGQDLAQGLGSGTELYLGDAMDFFLHSKRAGGRGERTIEDYRKKLELFQRWLAQRVSPGGEEVDVPYASVGADEVEAYVVYLRDGRGMADSSRKNHLAVLRSFFQTIARRLEVPDPTRTLDEVRFHQGAPKRSYLTKTEAGILFSAIKRAADGEGSADEHGFPGSPAAAKRRTLARVLAARDHAAFSTMVYAGLRIEETTALTPEDLDFSRGEEALRVARGKGNKERLVPMSPKLKSSLKRYLKIRENLLPGEDGRTHSHLFLNEKGARVTENTLRRRLYGWVRKSGLIKKADLKPHDLRRTFGTWYLQDNPGQVRELAELMGHSDLSQVIKYALSDEERARAGVAKL